MTVKFEIGAAELLAAIEDGSLAQFAKSIKAAEEAPVERIAEMPVEEIAPELNTEEGPVAEAKETEVTEEAPHEEPVPEEKPEEQAEVRKHATAEELRDLVVSLSKDKRAAIKEILGQYGVASVSKVPEEHWDDVRDKLEGLKDA